VVATAIAAISLSACSGTSSSSGTTSTTTTSIPTTTSTTSGPTAAELAAESNGANPSDTDASGTEWLCRPGQQSDPCTESLTATVLTSSGQTQVEHGSDAQKPSIDCFYVYPTVSDQAGVIANLHIDPAETSVAIAQASRFSQVCRVYAPVYPQLTLHAITAPGSITAADVAKAYGGVVSAWEDYMAHYNDGRGVVVIGHSQGATMLIALLRSHVDKDPSVLRHLVSAIILGGNVVVPIGKLAGGSFTHIPACQSTGQTGCVVAYSSFDTQPPANSLFGRPGQGVSELTPGPPEPVAQMQVLCVNPASPSGGVADLDPYFPSASVAGGLGSQAAGAPAVSTPWVGEPDLYTGQCLDRDGASWLQVSAPINTGDKRQIVTESIGPTWGLHLVDVNIALGSLVTLVGDEARAYS